jgi:hypothetical protein
VFDYPLTGNGLPITPTDIIAQFGKVGRPAPVILNMSHYGDATTTELSLPKQQRLRDSLQDPANWRASGSRTPSCFPAAAMTSRAINSASASTMLP